jgi:hypothetical protein
MTSSLHLEAVRWRLDLVAPTAAVGIGGGAGRMT